MNGLALQSDAVQGLIREQTFVNFRYNFTYQNPIFKQVYKCVIHT